MTHCIGSYHFFMDASNVPITIRFHVVLREDLKSANTSTIKVQFSIPSHRYTKKITKSITAHKMLIKPNITGKSVR